MERSNLNDERPDPSARLAGTSRKATSRPESSKPNFLRPSQVAAMSEPEARAALLLDMKLGAKWLSPESPTEQLSVTRFYRTFPSLHKRMKSYLSTHHADTGGLFTHDVRIALFEEAGIEHRLKSRWVLMTLEDVVWSCQDKHWHQIAQLPSKLLAHIYRNGWMEPLMKRVPFYAHLFDARGKFCRSRYELIAHNILYDVPGIQFLCDVKYPEDKALNPNGRFTCDIRITTPQLWIEIYQYCFGFPAPYARGNSVTYLRKRRLKLRLQKKCRLTTIGVEVALASGKSKSYFQFALNFIAALRSRIKLPEQYFNKDWVRDQVKRWSTSRPLVQPPEVMQRLDVVARKLGLAKMDWEDIETRVLAGANLSAAIRTAGGDPKVVRGICRLSHPHGWQARTRRTGCATFYDFAQGRGSALLALCLALEHAAAARLGLLKQVRGLPPWLSTYLLSAAPPGRSGVLGMTYGAGQPRAPGAQWRSANFPLFISQGMPKYLLGGRSVSTNISRRGAVLAATDFLSRLSAQLGHVLVLDQQFKRSRRLLLGAGRSPLWVLDHPTKAEISRLARRVLLRLGLPGA
jgi:hypothetical protein